MTFVEAVVRDERGAWPTTFLWTVLPLVPFIIAEQLRPVGPRPGWRDYARNIAINLSTVLLAAPAGIAAGLCSGWLRPRLPWTPLSFSFVTLGRLPHVGPAIELLAMIFAPLFLHDAWFYCAHRLEHRIPLLWEFHKVHHADANMNASTFARDHFLQVTWRAFFPIFTLALLLDVSPQQAGQAAVYSSLFVVLWTMFCHSAIRVQLPWLDRLLVTPQVHRLHHALEPERSSSNFADFFPLFDLLFGTYRRPLRDEFAATGVVDSPGPVSVWAAQFGPLLSAARMMRARCLPRRVGRSRSKATSLPASWP